MIRSIVRWVVDKFIQYFKHYEHEDDTNSIEEYNLKIDLGIYE